MQYPGRACPLMKVIDILGNDLYIEVLFQIGESFMRCIWAGVPHIPATHIIELQHQFRIFSPAAWRSYLIYIVSFPESVTIPESFQSAFRTDTGTRQHDQFFLHTKSLCEYNHKGSGETPDGMII